VPWSLPITRVTALLLGACTLDLTDPAQTGLATDRASYVARYESGQGTYRQFTFTVVARFTNHTAGTLYLGRCYPDSPHPIYGVELVDASRSAWGSAFGPAWACVGHDDQIAVAAGETRVDTLQLRGPNGWDGRTGEVFGVMDGAMRLVYHVQECRGDGACPSARLDGRSNAFTVRVD